MTLFPFRGRFAGGLMVVVLTVASAIPGMAERDAARLLTIGNSFADDATAFLPAMAAAGGKQLVVVHANLGGASLERHARHLAAFNRSADDPDARPYKDLLNPLTGERRNLSLPEALALCPWDFVTVQQVSQLSFRPETYHPHVDQLLAAVRAAAPQAEILIHETWAYREDHPLFAEPGGVTPHGMHEGLQAAYRQLARMTGCRLIPVGEAWQVARATTRWRFTPDQAFDAAQAEPGVLPDQRASLNIGWEWVVREVDGKPELRLDAKHANVAGRYLGAAVFYLVLFDADQVPANYLPDGLYAGDAAALRAIAVKAVMGERTRTKPGNLEN